MNPLRSKPSFMTGIHYLDNLQYNGKEHSNVRMINRRFEFSKYLYSKDLFAHYGCVNAIEFSNDGEWLVSGGDDKRVLIWNIDKTLSGCLQPKVMKGEHNSNIFCLGFSTSHTKLFSAGNDEQVLAHDVATGEILDVFFHDEAVYGLSVDPVNENIFASACDDGRILVWDIRLSSNEPYTLASSASAYHAVMYNPVEPRFLATANAKDGVCLWDIRKPKVHLMKYGPTLLSQSAMSVRFNSAGTHLLALRRRFPPVLYEITSPQPAAEFDHHEYYNSCTMKSCCFAGDKDQYILSGSDDFKLYVWKIPDSVNSKKGVWVSKAHFVLRGHRSIVNQVRYNNTYGILASSGVEKIIKLWSSFPLSYTDDHSAYVSSKDCLRKVYSHEEYINLVLENGQFMSHDYSHHSVQEDPRMMAFFDSLVQRDIEGWTSDSSNATDAMNTCYVVQTSDSVSSSDSMSSSDEDIQETVNSSELTASNNETTLSNITDEQKDPILVRTIPYAGLRPLSSEAKEDSTATNEETPDPALDRISILIAQKRREQVQKTTAKLLHLNQKNGKLGKKSLHLLQKHKKCPLISGNNNSDSATANGHDPQRRLLLLKADKRKLLRKKRAKLSKDAVLEQKNSDSDESNKETNGECSQIVHNEDEGITSTEPTPVESEVAAAAVNSANPQIKSPKSEDLSNDQLNSTSNSINGTETSNTAISNSLIYFPSIGGKYNNRNYRKRSADDLEED
ncbi:DDB1- and CUL4-associated factor 5 [Trichonephila inaurata madagascariensis]|uniref:DDB1- and CUL4-associated factor 5 n=1 Tax=Trichonephila inaurata madagascariensis TaxID=2747483 RepID=A0A8X6XC49_9ARAC|nr:DDB1- and CUL4-associated factor 5 [Trichonephila inaurata madagascariensis]